MADKKTGFEEVEALLQDIGTKIEELIDKGKEAGGRPRMISKKRSRTLKKRGLP
jgi:hypothetical protein